MKSTTETENKVLSVAAFICYVLALTACGIACYALVTLSLNAYGDLGQGFHLTGQEFIDEWRGNK